MCAELWAALSNASAMCHDANSTGDICRGRFHAMIDDAIATIDTKERYRKYADIQKIINGLQPSLYLFEQAQNHPYQASYVDWPSTDPSKKIPIMGYDFAANLVQIHTERK